jgi:hypothetical protein
MGPLTKDHSFQSESTIFNDVSYNSRTLIHFATHRLNSVCVHSACLMCNAEDCQHSFNKGEKRSLPLNIAVKDTSYIVTGSTWVLFRRLESTPRDEQSSC